jgi:hypothetical protein
MNVPMSTARKASITCALQQLYVYHHVRIATAQDDKPGEQWARDSGI